jgi:hypothetical protein
LVFLFDSDRGFFTVQISSQLRAEMQSASDTSMDRPVVSRHQAVVVEAREYSPKSGGANMHLLVCKLVGGEHDGKVIYDYQGILSQNNAARNMALTRLNAAMAATGCADAPDTGDMVGKRLLITTKQRNKPDGTTEVNVSKYEHAGETTQPAKAQSNGAEIPGFLRNGK